MENQHFHEIVLQYADLLLKYVPIQHKTGMIPKETHYFQPHHHFTSLHTYSFQWIMVFQKSFLKMPYNSPATNFWNNLPIQSTQIRIEYVKDLEEWCQNRKGYAIDR